MPLLPRVLRSRRGNYATITAVSLTGFLGFGALAIDVSNANLVEQQLQNAADSAAHAAVMQLDGTDEGLDAARTAAGEVAAMNYAGGLPVEIEGSAGARGKLVFGLFDEDDRTFTESDIAEDVNAVRVTTSHDNTATAVMSSLTEMAFSPVATASAVRTLPGAGATDCFLPLAVPQCLIDSEYGVVGVQDITLVLNSDSVDNVGWANPNGAASASYLMDQLGDCKYSGEVSIGDPIDLNNGAVTSALSEMAVEIAGSKTSWDSSVWGAMPDQQGKSAVSSDGYGGTLEGVFLVFDDPSYCVGDGGKFNGTAKVSALVWGAVYDVVSKGAVEDKNIFVRLDTSREHDFGTDDGGPDWGVQAVSVALAE